MKSKIVLLVLFLVISSELFSQSFTSPCKDFLAIMKEDSYVIKNDNSKLEGKIWGGSIVNGYLKSVVLKDEAGNKYKFKADEIIALYVKPGDFAKFMIASDVDLSIKNLSDNQFDKVLNKEYIVFETNKKYNKKGTLALMQVLNSGFDSKIKVYQDPNASKTTAISLGGMTLTGGLDKSYLIVKNGEENTILIKKSKYDKQFSEIFGDKADEVLKRSAKKDIEWKDFPFHVFIYENMK